jgi:RNA polymerase sigma-70 factor (ECF subfamily)
MVTSPGASQREWELDDADSVVAFYRAYLGELHRYVSRLAGGDRARTEDVVQEVFVSLARAVQRGQLRTATTGWLVTTARYTFLHDERGHRRDHRRVLAVASHDEPATDDTVTTTDHVAVQSLLAHLGDVERAALVFRYLDDLPVGEVAALLDKSVEATESILARARRHVRAHAEELNDGR